MSALQKVPMECWASSTPEDLVSGRGLLANSIAGDFLLIEEQKATPVARHRNEEVAFEALFSGHKVDGRTSHLSTLARLSVPDFSAGAGALVRLREQSDSFAIWREHLAAALCYVDEIPESPDAIARAQAVLSNELDHSLSAVQKDLTKSPALSAIRAGVRRLAFAGVGSAVGAGFMSIAGEPVLGTAVGAASGLSANAIQTISEYLKERKAQRSTAAIWDLALSFRKDEG